MTYINYIGQDAIDGLSPLEDYLSGKSLVACSIQLGKKGNNAKNYKDQDAINGVPHFEDKLICVESYARIDWFH